MNKNSYTKVQLEKGAVYVYDFGSVKLHAYRTDDFLSDEVFIVEKDGKSVIIESPCFFDNIGALEKYAAKSDVQGILIAYHAAGGSFLPNVSKYATQNAVEYSEQGGGKDLINNFTSAFGAVFDNSMHKITNIIDEGRVTIGGIDFILTKTDEAYNIEIPEIRAVYTHMLGHDCHSIVGGPAHADAMIEELHGYIGKGCTLILTSHYTPEDLKDAQTKIDYLNKLKEIAAECKSAEEFKTAVNKTFPEYGGGNYLEMTANMFFA